MVLLTQACLLGRDPAVHPQAIRDVRNGRDKVHHSQHRLLVPRCGDGTDVLPASLARREIDGTRCHVPWFVEIKGEDLCGANQRITQ